MFGGASASTSNAAAASAAKNYAGYALHRVPTPSQSGGYQQWYQPQQHQWAAQHQGWIEPPTSQGWIEPATPNPQDFYKGSRLRVGAASTVPVSPLPTATSVKAPCRPVDADDDFVSSFGLPALSIPASSSVAVGKEVTSMPTARVNLQFAPGATLLPAGVGFSQPLGDVGATPFNLQALTTLLAGCDRATPSPTSE